MSTVVVVRGAQGEGLALLLNDADIIDSPRSLAQSRSGGAGLESVVEVLVDDVAVGGGGGGGEGGGSGDLGHGDILDSLVQRTAGLEVHWILFIEILVF